MRVRPPRRGGENAPPAPDLSSLLTRERRVALRTQIQVAGDAFTVGRGRSAGELDAADERGGVSRYTTADLDRAWVQHRGRRSAPTPTRILTPTTNSLALDDRGYIRTDPATEERRAERL